MKPFEFAKIVGFSLLLSVAPVALAATAFAQNANPPTAETPSQQDAQAPVVNAPSPGNAAPDQAKSALDKPDGAPSSTEAIALPDVPIAKQIDVGAVVIGSDGQKVGEVSEIKEGSAGTVQEIHVKHGGFLGFFGKTVVIPGDKVSGKGQAIRVGLTYEEVEKLPQIGG